MNKNKAENAQRENVARKRWWRPIRINASVQTVSLAAWTASRNQRALVIGLLVETVQPAHQGRPNRNRLGAIGRLWQAFGARADKEGWGGGSLPRRPLRA